MIVIKIPTTHWIYNKNTDTLSLGRIGEASKDTLTIKDAKRKGEEEVLSELIDYPEYIEKIKASWEVIVS